MAEDTRKRLLRYLNDAYASEIGGLMALKDLSLVASDDQVKMAVQGHIRVTERQADRLRDRILALGGDKSEPKAAVNSFIAKSSSLVNMFHDRDDKQTQDLIKAVAFEHFEIGAYISLRAYASAIGDMETAMLAESIMDEERQAADTLERLIPQVAVRPAYRTGDSDTGSGGEGMFGIPPAAFLLPGAILAIWGVGKWLEHRDASRNQFGTSYDRSYNDRPYDTQNSYSVPPRAATAYVEESPVVTATIIREDTYALPTTITQDEAGSALTDRE